jgi:glutaconate CoA-transferase subunit B
MMTSPTLSELFAVLLARDLADGERAVIGTNSDVQVAACNLARRMHAPNLWWISGPGGMANPLDNRIRSTADQGYYCFSSAMLDLPCMLDLVDWRIHFFDFAIAGALQVDRFGNINTVCIGPHARPRLRGPGAVGISALTALTKRYYVIMTRHDPGSFPDKVDFITGAGFLDGHESRQERGLPEGGPRFVISPLGVFDFEPVSKAMRVRSLHAGVSLADAQAACGFELMCDSSGPPQTVAPTATELRVLREQVDTTGALRVCRS